MDFVIAVILFFTKAETARVDIKQTNISDQFLGFKILVLVIYIKNAQI